MHVNRTLLNVNVSLMGSDFICSFTAVGRTEGNADNCIGGEESFFVCLFILFHFITVDTEVLGILPKTLFF